MNRRRLLRIAASTSLAAAGGCLGLFEDESPKLVALIPLNHYREPVTIHLRLDRGGERIHESSHDLDPNTSDILECPWGDEATGIVVSSRLDDEEEWTEFDVADHDSDCAHVFPMVSPDVRHLSYAAFDECEPPQVCEPSSPESTT